MTLAELRALVDGMPFNKLVGLRVKGLHSDGVTITCDFRKDLKNSAGVLHGGVFATLADAAVGISLAHHFGGRRPITTVELKVNYLRPVSSGRVAARAHLVRVGSRLCVGRVDILDAGKKLAAVALVTYMLLEDAAHRKVNS